MTLGLLVVSALMGQGIPAERFEVGPISLEVPAGWRRGWRFGTARFDAPNGNAYILVDASQTLTPNLDPAECRDKILINLGGKAGWTPLEVDGYPAAGQSIVERAQVGPSAVLTHRVVGCDGNGTWSILFEADLARAPQFDRIATFIIQSIRYNRKEPASKEAEKSPEKPVEKPARPRKP